MPCLPSLLALYRALVQSPHCQEKEWATFVESDVRSFKIQGNWKHAARDAQSWAEIVTEGGRRFTTEWRNEEEGCPCDAAQFSFSVVRETSLTKNTVNLAVVVDGWESRDTLDGAWELEKDFAKSTAAAFADKNLFLNGGSASYVQYSNSTLATNSSTFYSLEEFESYVDADDTVGGRTRVGAGIEQARSLLTAAPPASAAFMIVIIHAGDTMRFLPLLKEQADAARGEGVDVFAVGIGDFSSVEGTLEEIGGDTDGVFKADNFQALSDVLDKILVESSTIACEATDATLEIEFGVPIAGVSHPTGASFFDSVAILPIDDITSDGTDVAVQLETCMLANGIIRVITEVSYSDNQGNELDISSLHDAGEAKRCTTGSSPDNDSRSTWRKFVVAAKAAILVGGFATGIIVQLAWRPLAKLSCVMIGMALFVWLSKAATVQKKKWKRADFEISRRLGEGGFGCVFEAVERSTDKIYAMKVVDKRPLIVDGTVQLLTAETQNQSCLRHENVLRMDGYFENGVQAFIVLEFAPGGDLSTLPRSEMSDTRISSVLKQLADGLIHCHREGIIHRDIKPQNVLVGENGKIKLSDFGLSVKTDGRQVAGMCGTQGFMSPEMLEGLAYDFSTDIWSYGVLAYMLILWDMPTFFEGNIHWPADVYVNDEARDFLTRLLEFNPNRHLPLDQVETHPWIVMNSAP